MSGIELKALRTRKAKLEQDRKALRMQVSDLQEQQGNLSKKIRSVEQQIKSLQASTPIVTEHALLRFLERGLGMDMNQLREYILTEDVAAAAKQGTPDKILVPIEKGCKAVVRNGTVLTVVGGEF